MIRSDSISMVLRPILSPKWPKTSPPMGRLAELGEEERREDERCCRAVEEEVVPLDGRPDKAGYRHLAYRGCLPLVLSAYSLHKSLLCMPEPDADSGSPH